MAIIWNDAYEELEEVTLAKTATVYNIISSSGIMGQLLCNLDQIYLRDGNTKNWKQLVLGYEISSKNIVTVATVQGSSYICIQGVGVYTYNSSNSTLVRINLNGVTTSVIKGVVAAGSYLILYDSTTIYWSAVTDPTDFEPSLITGAGSSSVSYVKSEIVTCMACKNGFIIYTTTGAVAAILSGTMSSPLIYSEITGFPGIDSFYNMSNPRKNETHYAITKTGIYSISPSEATPLFSEVWNFIRGKTMQEYEMITPNSGNLKLVTSNKPLDLKIRTLYNDYLFFSYGLSSENAYQYVLILDIKLNRWGKISLNHVDILDHVEFESFKEVKCIDMNYTDISSQVLYQYHCADLRVAKIGEDGTYRSLKNRECSSFRFTGLGSSTYDIILVAIDNKGALNYVSMVTNKDIEDDSQPVYENINDVPIMILGDYSVARNNHTYINQITVDKLRKDSRVFVETTTEKNKEPTKQTYINVEGGDEADYYGEATGRQHKVHLVGQGILTTIEITVEQEGEV